ncbi:MAG: hypothetical protein KC419_22565 [Anaerolineales bacterium]|nr:hypothetical protein [Anaerolineales bacterium]
MKIDDSRITNRQSKIKKRHTHIGAMALAVPPKFGNWWSATDYRLLITLNYGR